MSSQQPSIAGAKRLIEQVWKLAVDGAIDTRSPAADAALDLRDEIDPDWIVPQEPTLSRWTEALPADESTWPPNTDDRCLLWIMAPSGLSIRSVGFNNREGRAAAEWNPWRVFWQPYPEGPTL